MAKNVKLQPTPNLVSKPVVNFTIEEQDAMVYNKGVDVTIESAIKCPCKTKDNDNLSTCENCSSTGWVFINKTQDRVIISSINFETKYKEWSAEKLGTINLTLRSITKVSFMDKVIIKDSNVRQSEVIYPIPFDGNYFSYTIYDIESVEDIFQYVSTTDPLLKLELFVDFRFERNKIILLTIPAADVAALKALTSYEDKEKALLGSDDSLYQFDSTSTAVNDDDLVIIPDNITHPAPGRWLKLINLTLTVRYYHKLQYYVLDIPHVIRNSYRKDYQGRDELQLLPVNAIARLSHYVLEGFNFAGDNIIDNSYDPDAVPSVTTGLGSMFIVS